MNITYQQFEASFLSAVLELQNEWFFEDITFGIVPETAKDIIANQNEYFFIALDEGKVIAYTTAEVIKDNGFNVFPFGASFLRVNDLYVAKDYRSQGIGEKLLSLIEQRAYANGLQHIFISSATKDAEAVRNFYVRNGYDIWTTMFYKRRDWETRIYPLNELGGYRFVVIFVRFQGKWLYCRARDRDTFETPGGHIEKDETPLEAARRELYEETGALKFDIKPLFDYSVHTPDSFANGQVFYGTIHELGSIPDYEMAEVKCFDTIPEKMRFPQILPILFERVQPLAH